MPLKRIDYTLNVRGWTIDYTKKKHREIERIIERVKHRNRREKNKEVSVGQLLKITEEQKNSCCNCASRGKLFKF